MKKIIIIICMLSFSLYLYTDNWKYYSKSYLQLDTINDSFKDLAIDSAGTVWVLIDSEELVCINDSNVFKFDDNGKLKSLADPYGIEIDDNNNVWINALTTIGTIINNEIKVMMEPQVDGVDLYFLYDLRVVGNTAWFTSKYGLHKVSSNKLDKWDLYDSTNSIMKFGQSKSLEVDRNGAICVPNGNGLVRIVNNNFSRELFNNMNDLIVEGKNVLDYMNNIAFDNNNKLWIATYDYGLFKYENPNWVRYPYVPPIFHRNFIIDIKSDTYGNLWLACDNLVKYDGSTFSIVNHPTRQYTVPYNIKIDKNNTIWFVGAGEGNGVYCYNENGIPTTKNEEKIKKSESIFYPNPVTRNFNMSFEIKHNVNLVIDIYDISGNKIATALNELRPIGTTEFNYDVSKLQNGTYILKLTNGPWNESIKFVVNR